MELRKKQSMYLKRLRQQKEGQPPSSLDQQTSKCSLVSILICPSDSPTPGKTPILAAGPPGVLQPSRISDA
uniref:Syntaxin-43 n=1 Tax=Rhizophora mucronata TaxID=61149 RepID=A0A2P2JBI4_RHIMU